MSVSGTVNAPGFDDARVTVVGFDETALRLSVPWPSGSSMLTFDGSVMPRVKPETTLKLKFCVALPAELVAVTAPEKLPSCVGVPVIAPADESTRPGGRAPEVTEKVGAGMPLAVKLKL